ncbi:hypothetical protein Tco_0128010 [Tanacetum coccineum]
MRTMEWSPMCEELEKAVGAHNWVDMMIVYFQIVADEHQDFALRVNRLIGEMNEACSDREAFVRELQNVTGETVPAMTVGFLKKMMYKEGNMEWQLRGLEKEAREMAFEIQSFLFKLMDAEPSHRRVFCGDDGQRGPAIAPNIMLIYSAKYNKGQ